MSRLLLAACCLLPLSACENRDRLSDEQAAAAAAQATNELIVPDSGGEATTAAAAATGPGELLYRALGTEPGWSLIIRREAMLYQGDYGTVRIVEATPPGFTPTAGKLRSGRLAVSIRPGPCSDGMSDHVWRDKVTVEVAGGRTASGCGGGLVAVTDPNAIEGVRYRVTAINGGAVRAPSGWWLSFAGEKVSGQFGCNIFGGSYRRNGDHLSLTSGLEQNAMGCARSIEAWDRAGQSVLGSNPRIEKVGGIVRLVSEAGSIDLAPPAKEIPTT